MRATQTCPECSGKRFLVMAKLQVVTSRGLGSVPALMVDNAGEVKSSGSFETWTCLGCGYTALYASGHDFTNIEGLLRAFPEQVRVVDARPKDGPYR